MKKKIKLIVQFNRFTNYKFKKFCIKIWFYKKIVDRNSKSDPPELNILKSVINFYFMNLWILLHQLSVSNYILVHISFYRNRRSAEKYQQLNLGKFSSEFCKHQL